MTCSGCKASAERVLPFFVKGDGTVVTLEYGPAMPLWTLYRLFMPAM